MKILWIINTVLPEIAADCGLSIGVGGGWLEGISESFLSVDINELIICFPNNDGLIEGKIGRITYYSFQTRGFYKYHIGTEDRIIEIIKKEKPELIHVFGTEFPHSLAAVNAAEKNGMIDKTVISIQGLVSVYAKHYYANLDAATIHKCTLRDCLKHDNIFWQRKKFEKRGKFEIDAIKSVKHIIGRTDWDEACVRRINDTAEYHFCNETLRKAFYSGQWNYSNCEKHSIFIGSCSYPIKGLHCVLEIMPQIIRKYPDARLYVAGHDPLNGFGMKGLLHRSYYSVYLKKMITRLKLSDKVEFLGSLSAEEMKARMLKSNVLILPSSIENSPNTLGEALLLGVPCIAADVGGIKNLATDKEEILIYPFDENYMIPYYVSKIFDNPQYAQSISDSARRHANVTHNRDINNKQLIRIYLELIES